MTSSNLQVNLQILPFSKPVFTGPKARLSCTISPIVIGHTYITWCSTMWLGTNASKRSPKQASQQASQHTCVGKFNAWYVCQPRISQYTSSFSILRSRNWQRKSPHGGLRMFPHTQTCSDSGFAFSFLFISTTKTGR